MDDAPASAGAAAPELRQRLAAAEASLRALEAPRQAMDMAKIVKSRTEQKAALGAATPEEVTAAHTAHVSAVKAHADAGIDPRSIHVASQAVLDARAALNAAEGDPA